MSDGLSASLNSLGRWVGRALAPSSGPRNDDWSLWRAASRGDESCARALVRQLTPQATGLARQLLTRTEDAEDAVQESFLRLWTARPSDAHGATLATYFNTIVINRCRSVLVRRQELSTDPELLAALADGRPPEVHSEVPLAAIDAPRLRAAMQRLPARQRMALAMWAYADADAVDIARSLDIDTNAAHQLLHRAKGALRRTFEEKPS